MHEAHLVSRSLNQSESLRFGSGRLLEDIIKFLNPESNRKIVMIGDPYSLTYGKIEDSALNLEILSKLYQQKKIKHYKKELTVIILTAKKNYVSIWPKILKINCSIIWIMISTMKC